MLNMQIMAVKDRALDAYMTPIFVRTINEGMRMFQDEVNRPDSTINKHADDYDLWHLGVLDTVTGKIIQEQPPQQIALGKNMLQRE